MTQEVGNKKIDIFMKHATNMLVPSKSKSALNNLENGRFVLRAVHLDGKNRRRVVCDGHRAYQIDDPTLQKNVIEHKHVLNGQTISGDYPIQIINDMFILRVPTKGVNFVTCSLNPKEISRLLKQLKGLLAIMKATGEENVKIALTVNDDNVCVTLDLNDSNFVSSLTAFNLTIAKVEDYYYDKSNARITVSLPYVIELLALLNDSYKDEDTVIKFQMGCMRFGTTRVTLAPSLYVESEHIKATILGYVPK